MDDTKNRENTENNVLYNKIDNIDAPPRTVHSFIRDIFETNDDESDKSEEEEEEEDDEEEEYMENNPMDKLIPNHKELSREEISKEIFKYVNKINNDPEVIKQNEENQHNALMKLLGINNNEAPSRSPITYRTLQKNLIDKINYVTIEHPFRISDIQIF